MAKHSCGVIVHCNQCDVEFKAPQDFETIGSGDNAERVTTMFVCPNGHTDCHWLYLRDVNRPIKLLDFTNKKGQRVYHVGLLWDDPVSLEYAQREMYMARPRDYCKEYAMKFADFYSSGDAWEFATMKAKWYGEHQPWRWAVVVW